MAPISVNKEYSTRSRSYDNGRASIVVPELPLWLKTSVTGLWILELLENEPRSLTEFLDHISAQTRLPLEAIREPVLNFVQECANCGLLENTDLEVDPFVAENACDLGLQQIWFQITNVCDLNCDHCYVPESAQVQSFMVPEVLLDTVRQAEQMKCPLMVVSGGEPTLHPELPAILRDAREAFSGKIQLVTNGFGQARVPWDDVLPHIDDLQVSLDGVQPETHDRHRRAGSFDAIMELMRATADRKKLSRGISFTPLPDNLDEIPSLYRLALRMRANYIHLNRPKPAGRQVMQLGDRKPWYSAPEFLRACFEQFNELKILIFTDLEVSKANPNSPVVHLDLSFEPGNELLLSKKRSICAAGSLTLCIDADGGVYPCTALCRRVESLANLRDVSLAEAHRLTMASVAKAFSVDRDPVCAVCDFRYFCGGGCRANADGVAGHDVFCEVYKQQFESWLENAVVRKV